MNRQPQRGRLHRGEAHFAPAVSLQGILGEGCDRLPISAIAVFDTPRGRQSARASTGVVEPVDLAAGHGHRPGPRVLHPLVAVLMRPEMTERLGLLATTF